MQEGKSFQISKHQILHAYKCVKANKGAGGIERFLKAPIVMNDGELKERSSGTPQGGY